MVLFPYSSFPLFLLDFRSPPDEEEDEEEVYKMAGVMAQCGGLECMLNRLAGIKDFKQGRHLLTVSWRQQGETSLLLWERPLMERSLWPFCHLTLEGSMVAQTSARPRRTWWLPEASHLGFFAPLPSSRPPPPQKASVSAAFCCVPLVTCGTIV